MIRKFVCSGLCLLTLASFSPQKNRKGGSSKNIAVQIDYKSIGAPLPDLRVPMPNGKIFSQRDMDTSGNFFLMMFNPTCGHCEDVTRMLAKNLDRFRDGQILLVSGPAMMPYMEFFNSTTKVFQYPKIKVGVDSSEIIEKTFIYKSLPQINIYDKNRRLVKTFTGEVSIDSLQPYIR